MRADFKRAQSAAEALLAKYHLDRAPIDPEAIAEACGIDVVYAHFNGELRNQVAGYSDPQNNQIVVNQAMPANRKTYTIAHELGHHQLHRDYLADDGAYQIFPRMNSYDGLVKPPEEQEADAFAANLLVPMKLLRRYKDVATISELSKTFMVSEAVILNRLKFA